MRKSLLRAMYINGGWSFCGTCFQFTIMRRFWYVLVVHGEQWIHTASSPNMVSRWSKKESSICNKRRPLRYIFITLFSSLKFLFFCPSNFWVNNMVISIPKRITFGLFLLLDNCNVDVFCIRESEYNGHQFFFWIV